AAGARASATLRGACPRVERGLGSSLAPVCSWTAARRRCDARRLIMLMRRLGRSGLRVAALCLGGNTFGWTTDQKTSEAVLDAYVEAGGNFSDTADVYARWAPGNSGGESETALGTWMKARRNRGAVLIATKVMGAMGPGPNDTGLSRQHIMAGLEASLRRL